MIENLNKREMERIYAALGSQERLAKYLGMTVPEVRELNLRTACQQVEDLTNEQFVELFLKSGSSVLLAKRMFVSNSKIMKEIERRGIGVENVAQGLFPPVKWENLEGDLTRIGSVRMVAAVYGVSQTEVRSMCEKKEIDPKKFVRIEAAGQYESGLGRQSELEFIKLRGDQILKDCNVEEGSQYEFDVMDAIFDRVNVKSSRVWYTKKRKRYWKFSLNGRHTCDYLALMFYDSKHKKLEKVVMCSVITLWEVKSKTLTVREGDWLHGGAEKGDHDSQVIYKSEA